MALKSIERAGNILASSEPIILVHDIGIAGGFYGIALLGRRASAEAPDSNACRKTVQDNLRAGPASRHGFRHYRQRGVC